MILLAVLLAQAEVYGNTAQEEAFCASPQSDQPLRFCLADQKYERARRQVATALAAARRSAAMQKQEVGRFVRTTGGVTLAGDPVRALEASQRAWQRSYQADCLVVGLAAATGNAGTEGVTVSHDCEADRMLDRARFLINAYPIRR